MRHLISMLLACMSLCGASAVAAGPLGADFLFECALCTPAAADRFVGRVGPGDYYLQADGYAWNEVDAEASTITIKTLVEGYTRSPLIFRLSWLPEQFRLLDVTVSSSSTFQTSFSWGAGELVVDMGDQYFAQGAQIAFDVTAAPVPEPAPWLMSATAVALWLLPRQRKGDER